MARIVTHVEKGPAKVEIGGETKFMCMCGLSKNRPFCDSSHMQTLDEEDGKMYKYEDPLTATHLKVFQ